VFGMKNKFVNSNIFLRYLTSHILLFSLPVIVLGFIAYNQFVESLKSEVLANNANTLNRVKYVVEEQLKQMENISNQIHFVNSDIRRYSLLPHDPIKSYVLTTELRKYSETLLFFQEVALYFVGTEQVYTNKSIFDVQYLLEDIYQFQDLSSEQFYYELNHLNKWYTRPAKNTNDGERYLTFIHPFSRGGNNPDRVVLFFVKENNFHQIFSNEIINIPGINIILDQNNQVITSFSENGVEAPQNLVDKLRDLHVSGVETIYDDAGQSFFLMAEQSQSMGWTFIRMIPEDKVLQSIAHVRNSLFFGLFIIIVVGIVLVYFSMSMNYKPIGRLKRYTQTIWKESIEPLNELDLVRKAIDSIALQNSKLHSEVQDNREAYRDHLLFSLLKGRVASLEQFNENAERVSMSFSKSTFGIAVIQYKFNVMTEHRKRGTLREIESLLPSEMEGLCREHFDENKIVIILALDTESAGKALDLLKTFHNKLINLLGDNVTIGVGEFSNNFNDIPRSYIEASYAVGYRFVMGNNRLIAIDEVNQSEMNKVYPAAVFDRIRKAIQSGEKADIDARLKEFIAIIKSSGTTLYWARKLCYDIVNLVSITMKEFHSIDMVSSGYNLPDVFVLEKFETIEEFSEVINYICNDIYNSLLNKPEAGYDVDDIVLMEQYIMQYYSECDFSTQQMADHFGMASSNLSQYFKDRTGKTLLNYITNLRMEKAKQLLSSGKLELRYVAEEVGYYNVSSFIRRFKQIVGVTPGEFRKD